MKRSLTKAEILRSRGDIARVFRARSVFRTDGLHLRIAASETGWSRVLFATPRVYRRAVHRNRDRRLMREAYRMVKHRIRGHHDIALILYPGSYGLTERQTQLEILLQRAGAIPDR